jgi:chemotaxis protein methyltransferase CheR
MEYFGELNDWDIDIHATDISTKMLKRASEGIYSQDRLQKIPIDLKRRYFRKGVNKWEGYFRVKPHLRKTISFERLNLIESFPSDFSFDIIFCRNVMIYFDKTIQEKIVNKLYDALNPKGYLFIGHAESLTGIDHQFKYIQPSIYRK